MTRDGSLRPQPGGPSAPSPQIPPERAAGPPVRRTLTGMPESPSARTGRGAAHRPLGRLRLPRLSPLLRLPRLPCLLGLLCLLSLLSVLGAPAAAAAGGGREEWVPPVPGVDVAEPFRPPAQRWLAGHRGVDLLTRPGAVVRAAGPGVIGFVGRVAGVPIVTVVHGQLRTTYQPVLSDLRVGQPVLAGTPLGRLGLLGGHCLPRACLHWGLLRGDTYLDPMSLLDLGPPRLLPLTGPLTGSLTGGSAGPAAVRAAVARKGAPVTVALPPELARELVTEPAPTSAVAGPAIGTAAAKAVAAGVAEVVAKVVAEVGAAGPGRLPWPIGRRGP